MDDTDDPSPIADYELAAMKERLDQVLKVTTAALDHAVSLAQAGKRDIAMGAVLALSDVLHAAARLAEAYERLLVAGQSSDPDDPASSLN